MLLPRILLESTQMALSVKKSKVHSYSRIEVVIHVLKHISANCLFNRQSLLSDGIQWRSDGCLVDGMLWWIFFFSHITSHQLIFTSAFFSLLWVLGEQWVEIENIVFMYLIHRWLLVVRCGWPHSICVWVCAHLHLCACVVLGANDSWHLATISGSLISMERFGGETQIPLYLSNRCVFDPLTQVTHMHARAHRHTHIHSHIHSHCPSRTTIWRMETSMSNMLILTAIDWTRGKQKIWISSFLTQNKAWL